MKFFVHVHRSVRIKHSFLAILFKAVGFDTGFVICSLFFMLLVSLLCWSYITY